MRLSRRIAALLLMLVAFCPAHADDNRFRVVLLGTGTPAPSLERFGYSTLVEAGGQRLLFDFGRGVTIRLAQLHIALGSINAHFLTHFHSDHMVGLPDLWLTGWLRPPYGNRNAPMALYGPPGLTEVTRGLTTAFARDIAIRREDEHDPEAGIAFDVHEVAPGPIYDHDGVTVTAFTNDHGTLVTPSYGYAIAYHGHRVVLSGDTRYSPAVVEAARGADLLVHCVTVIPDDLLKSVPAYKAVYEHLASPEAAGRTFAEARPKLALFSHIGLNGNATEDDLLRRTRTVYDGPLKIGHDLMAVDIGDEVKVEK